MKQSGRLITLAIAEDHMMMRRGLIALLDTMGGFEVILEAIHGRDLIAQLNKMKEPPDCCLLDISMPVMDGFETIAALKKRWPKMGVLVMTMFDDELYIIRMIRAGANGYLLKSCNPEEMKNALITIFNKDIYYSKYMGHQILKSVLNNHVQLPQFSEMEIQVMKYACSDLTYAGIAEKLKITPKSVEGHRDSLFRKLNVTNRVSLAFYAVRLGYVQLESIIFNPKQPDKIMKKLLTCLVSFVLLLASCAGHTGQQKKQPFFDGSVTPENFIPTDSANKMVWSYLKSLDTAHNDTDLRSVYLDAEDLRSYLNDTNIRQVKISLAHNLGFISKNGSGHMVGYNSNALTVVVSGISSSGAYILYKGSSVINHAMPCPSNCVSGDLFPSE